MPRVGATLAVVPIPTMNGEGRPQADRPTCLTVGTPLPGCPDRATKRRTRFDFPWQSPGKLCGFVQCSRRFPRRFAPRNDRLGGRAYSPGCGSRFGASCGTVDAHSLRGDPQTPPYGDRLSDRPRRNYGNAKVLVILLQKRFCRRMGFR